MEDIFVIIGDYLKGKSIYPSLRRLLNLLFNISIASYIFEKYYGEYKWLSISEYQKILDFFIKGHFFIPFSIFVLVYSFTQVASILLFNVVNHFRSIRWTREIILYEIKKETIDERFRDINQLSKFVAPSRLTKTKLLELYNTLKTHITPQLYEEMEKGLKEPKQDLENNFNLIFRGWVAITVYFIYLPQFGCVLYLIICLLLIIEMYSLMIAYRFLDILPTLVRKLHTVTEDYLKSIES
jgi:hypothetical protein